LAYTSFTYSNPSILALREVRSTYLRDKASATMFSLPCL
jgi:hypothetical protein